MAFGKTIEFFLVNGTADSIITAELSNWNGKAMGDFTDGNKMVIAALRGCRKIPCCDDSISPRTFH